MGRVGCVASNRAVPPAATNTGETALWPWLLGESTRVSDIQAFEPCVLLIGPSGCKYEINRNRLPRGDGPLEVISQLPLRVRSVFQISARTICTTIQFLQYI